MPRKSKTREAHHPSPTAIAAEALRTGVAPQPSGALRTTAEILDERDRHRALLEVPDPKE